MREVIVTTFPGFLYDLGTTHLPYLSCTRYLVSMSTWERMLHTRLSSASRSRMRSEKVLPLRPLTLYRIAVGYGSHTLFAQHGSCFIFVSPKRLPFCLRIVNELEGFRDVSRAHYLSQRYVEILPCSFPLDINSRVSTLKSSNIFFCKNIDQILRFCYLTVK